MTPSDEGEDATARSVRSEVDRLARALDLYCLPFDYKPQSPMPGSDPCLAVTPSLGLLDALRDRFGSR